MKKVVVLCTVFVFSIAFELGTNLKAQTPGKGNFSATAGIEGLAGAINTNNSTTGSLLFKYYLTDNLALRGAFSFARLPETKSLIIDTASVGVSSGTGIPPGNEFYKQTTNISGNTFRFETGVQYKIVEKEKLEPYIGAVLSMGIGGSKLIEEKKDWLKDNPATGRIKGDYEYATFEQNQAREIGGKLVLGMVFYPLENIGIGAEFGYGYFTTGREGGTHTYENVINGGDVERMEYELNNYKEEIKGFKSTGGIITVTFYL